MEHEEKKLWQKYTIWETEMKGRLWKSYIEDTEWVSLVVLLAIYFNINNVRSQMLKNNMLSCWLFGKQKRNNSYFMIILEQFQYKPKLIIVYSYHDLFQSSKA